MVIGPSSTMGFERLIDEWQLSRINHAKENSIYWAFGVYLVNATVTTGSKKIRNREGSCAQSTQNPF